MTRLLNRRLILLALGVITPILLTSLACNDSAEGELNSGASGQPAETKEDYWRNLTVEDVATRLDQGEHIDLHSAVANSRDPAIIALLLDRGADIEAEYRHPLSGGSPLRGCRQNNLVQMTSARIWQIARKDAAFLAYRVATPRHCLKSRNEFSTKCRSLYSARS